MLFFAFPLFCLTTLIFCQLARRKYYPHKYVLFKILHLTCYSLWILLFKIVIYLSSQILQFHLAAITGGLDSKLAVWDFSKGRTLFSIDYGSPKLQNGSSSSSGQCFNPAFVHSIAVSEEGILGGIHKVCAVARGDGAVDVVDLEYELAPAKSKGTSRMAGLSLSIKNTDVGDGNGNQSQGKRLHLDYMVGGHTAAVSSVAFSAFGEKGKFLVSGGNDSSVKLWDWTKGFSSETNSNGELVLDMNVKKKVNWLCTAPTDSDNLIVCDTSKVVKVYNLP
ncbi:hypothetical protein GUJ93_ZPchr0001g33006 [Zizania palustris]|uniref:Uncharacterized protein n=1 Tax=Zizania palustris TaxID=103762 RepID=A0A8J5RN58_ZIZPA|nr:hypothetical protein GUJ93_ZPchr0001g33006 [Zizania palustris]